jgi:hypothetical protein
MLERDISQDLSNAVIAFLLNISSFQTNTIAGALTMTVWVQPDRWEVPSMLRNHPLTQVLKFILFRNAPRYQRLDALGRVVRLVQNKISRFLRKILLSSAIIAFLSTVFFLVSSSSLLQLVVQDVDAQHCSAASRLFSRALNKRR